MRCANSEPFGKHRCDYRYCIPQIQCTTYRRLETFYLFGYKLASRWAISTRICVKCGGYHTTSLFIEIKRLIEMLNKDGRLLPKIIQRIKSGRSTFGKLNNIMSSKLVRCLKRKGLNQSILSLLFSIIQLKKETLHGPQHGLLQLK